MSTEYRRVTDGQTDGQTSCDSIVRATRMRRGVKTDVDVASTSFQIFAKNVAPFRGGTASGGIFSMAAISRLIVS